MSFLPGVRRFCTSNSKSKSTNINNICNNVAVIGSGQMGVGIAICSAFVAQKKVTLIDNNQQMLDNGLQFIHSWLSKQQTRNDPALTHILDANTNIDNLISESISVSTDMNAIADHKCDFVIEAVSEIEHLKKSIFQDLDRIALPAAILASNTSSIPISKIASFVSPERRSFVAGMHFMNPVPVMKLVEVIPSLMTSEDTLSTVQQFSADMNKVSTISSDSAGFIANRILMPYINEAVFCLQEGIATREDIDLTMKLGTNVPMGPLTLADFIGIDTCLYIMQTLNSQLSDSKYRPAPLLQRMVECGLLGKKVGKGFYEYRAK